MKKMINVVLGLVLSLSMTGMGMAADNPAAKDQAPAPCPVMGGKVNPHLCTNYKGQQVYFCCPACVEIFKKDPEKYLKKQQ